MQNSSQQVPTLEPLEPFCCCWCSCCSWPWRVHCYCQHKRGVQPFSNSIHHHSDGGSHVQEACTCISSFPLSTSVFAWTRTSQGIKSALECQKYYIAHMAAAEHRGRPACHAICVITVRCDRSAAAKAPEKRCMNWPEAGNAYHRGSMGNMSTPRDLKVISHDLRSLLSGTCNLLDLAPFAVLQNNKAL